MSLQSEGAAARPGRESNLETQWVEVSDELRFCWHRPPLEEVERQYGDPGTVRIFLNGCFDLMHVGHFNALRQAKSLFSRKGYGRVILIAGIHSDAAIAKQKGAPLMSDEERLAVLRSTKWVDELATDLPYVSMSAKMADALRVHFICHGDDLPVCRSGDGMYSDAIQEGRFQVLKRTEGISTTQILDRLLRREQATGRGSCGAAAADPSTADGVDRGAAASVGALEATPATVWRLTQFAAPSDPRQPPRPLDAAQRVVYVVGAFDLLHPGHVEFLERAAGLGDYLLVGLYSDETLHRYRGFAPVLTLPERAMAVLSLRHVDDVVLGAPWLVGRELLTAFNICTVAVGRRPGRQEDEETDGGGRGHEERFSVPLGMGILAEVRSSCPLTAAALAARCLGRGAELAERNRGLLAKELAYIGEKGFVPEA